MPLSLDEVEDLIDSWEIDPDVDTVRPATELFATMAVGDPGRLDVLHVIAVPSTRRSTRSSAAGASGGRSTCRRTTTTCWRARRWTRGARWTADGD